MHLQQSRERRRWLAATGLVLVVAGLNLMLGRWADPGGHAALPLLAESPTALAVDSRTGRAFIATSGPGGGGHVLVLDTATGRLRGRLALAAAPAALAVDERGGQVLLVTADSLWLLDATRGTVLRHTPLPPSPVALAVDGPAGRAVVLSAVVSTHPAVSVSVLDTHRGALLRTLSLGTLPGLLALDRRAQRVLLTSPGGGEETLFVLDARSGALLHTRRLDGHATGLAVDERRGRAYLVSGDPARLRVLDTRSGAVLRTRPLAAWPMAVAVEAATGRVLLQEATEAGVRTLDPRTGRLVRIGVGPDPGTHLLLADGPRVVLARWGRGTLTLRPLSRGGRCTVPVGGDLVALATDERARRTVVLSGADLLEANGPDWAAWAHALLTWPPRLPPLRTRRQFVAGVVSDPEACA